MAGTVHALHVMKADGSFAVPVQPSTYINTRALAANTAEAIAVPAGAKYVVFGADCSFGARYNATLAGTAAAFGDVTDGSGIDMNPTVRYLIGTVAEISIITAATTGNVSAMFFS